MRNPESGKETVRLISGNHSVYLDRDIEGEPGDIAVECEANSSGNELPVDYIYVEFRGQTGYVFPRAKGSFMRFTIGSDILETPGEATKIIAAAERAVKKKILAHFQ